VIEGGMSVLILQDHDSDRGGTTVTTDETIIDQGETSDVPPGVRHEFYSQGGCKALEFYWTALDPDDIQRETTGGIRVNS
jgi:mannose-6-phosphate isomerase-like protein (cupin superfamily)